ncbi:MAG: hypothetical protein QW578_06460, partial [Thermoplasmatales archaeon]
LETIMKLANYISGNIKTLDLASPEFAIKYIDSELKDRILSMTSMERKAKKIKIYAVKPAICNAFDPRTVSFCYIDSIDRLDDIKKITLYEDDLLPRSFYSMKGGSLEDLANQMKEAIEHTIPPYGNLKPPKTNYPIIKLWREPSFVVRPVSIRVASNALQKTLEKPLKAYYLKIPQSLPGSVLHPLLPALTLIFPRLIAASAAS